MGTYAVYRLWAGVTNEELQEAKYPFIDEVLNSIDDVRKDGLNFTSIGMHGETVGVGVEVQELSWETEIGKANLYDAAISDKAVEVLRRVNEIFQKLGIQLTAKLYHHLDLGG